MTAAFLQSELTNLIQEAKKKNNDVRDAAERSLRELKSVTVTSEAQLAGDLIRKPTFVDSFILACRSQNVRLTSSGAAGLQRLVASAAVPRTRLPDLLSGFEEAATRSVEVQLKILQTLPSLVQLYDSDLTDDLWLKLLNICADLSGNKQAVVSSTAGATCQQLVLSIFDRHAIGGAAPQSTDDRQDSDSESCDLASRVFQALCLSLASGASTRLRFHGLPLSLTLQIIEEVIARHGARQLEVDRVLDICSTHLVPRIIYFAETSASWTVVTRAHRIGLTLLSLALSQIPLSLCDYLLALLKALEKPPNSKWKRVLALEAFQNLCTDFTLLQNIYTTYDHEPQRPKIVVRLVAALVRIAAEEPTLIGLGRQSTLPAMQNVDDSSDVMADVDAIGSGSTFGAVTQGDVASVGLSMDWSTIPTPCLEQHNRSAPPEIPATYVYTLVLGCVAAISEGLSRSVVPLSVPTRRRTRTVTRQASGSDSTFAAQSPIQDGANGHGQPQAVPLKETTPGRPAAAEVGALIIESCWPGILAACSTFLNASLDPYFYHVLIRTTQKLTQVSDILELATPRDAFLTTLAKSSVPTNVSSILDTFYAHDTAQILKGAGQDVEADHDLTKVAPRTLIDPTLQSFNIRNLLCLRALLNLGIALGQSLSAAAWSIILQPMQQIDALMSLKSNVMALRGATGNSVTGDGAALSSETTAVDAARRKLIELSGTYPDAAFAVFVESIFAMIDSLMSDELFGADSPLFARTPNTPGHRIKRSVSGIWTRSDVLRVEVQFVLKMVGRVVSVNLDRFGMSELAWNLIVQKLLKLLKNRRLKPDLRLQISNIIDAIVVESFKGLNNHNPDENSPVPVIYGLQALDTQVDATLPMPDDTADIAATNAQIRYQLMLAVENIVNTCGDTLDHGWQTVLRITERVVVELDRNTEELTDEYAAKVFVLAFKITQTIVSDFLPSLGSASIFQVLQLVSVFARQKPDLNMTLTAIALMRSINSAFLERSNNVYLTQHVLEDQTASREASRSDFWSLSAQEISRMNKDDRSDVRNANLRMFFDTITSATPKMSSQTINDCARLLFIPLISYYYEQKDDLSSWTTSAGETIILVTRLICDHAALFSDGTEFEQTWRQLMVTFCVVLENHELEATTTILRSTSSMLTALRAASCARPPSRDKQILSIVWHKVWTSYHPADIEPSTASNIEALSAYLNLLQTMEFYNREAILSFDQSIDQIRSALSKALLSAVHDQYTFDTTKISEEQELVLRGLRTMSILLGDDFLELNNFVLTLVQRSLAALTATRGNSDKPESTSLSRNLKAPTRIAFMTHCFQELRKSINQSRVRRLSEMVDVNQLLDTCIVATSTKHDPTVSHGSSPLWKKSTALATELLTILGEQRQKFPDVINDNVSSKSVEFVATVLETPQLESRQAGIEILNSELWEDELYDIDRFRELHAALITILSCSAALRTNRKRYILLLFNHSFATKLWHNDLTSDIVDAPLADLTKIRRGSIREPILPIRREIGCEALKALFKTTDSTTSCSDLAILAAPYILLRVAHSLKTFITDQRLRYLNPPHKALRQDLARVLELLTTLRINATFFTETAKTTGYEDLNVTSEDDTAHLRLLWGLYEKFSEAWRRAPRLDLLAWQDGEEGQSIEASLRRWRERLTGKWGPEF